VKRDPVTEALQFKLRNTVKGYMQEQGIDYDQSFAEVAGDTAIRLTLATSLYEEQKNDDWAVEAIDVEAAILEGQMDHELYIHQPYMYQEYYVKPGINQAGRERRYSPKDIAVRVSKVRGSGRRSSPPS
jgi:hypothetical protein